ncbi:hypothetical protein [Streptomyces apricus]|uniref:Uncharacterized protein n=1 Tax=Streptomyces apricus TaxID=1828112 RepID=A0A5A9YYA1_9ACTN|nr:hypothetical protein [Streptomyces apricus]KAA0909838.1 hypothetical protein FGF04_39200 [Streptomyces apricus]
MIMFDSSVVPHPAGVAGPRSATAHRNGVPAAPAAGPGPEPEWETAELTTVFDIMGRIFGAV